MITHQKLQLQRCGGARWLFLPTKARNEAFPRMNAVSQSNLSELWFLVSRRFRRSGPIRGTNSVVFIPCFLSFFSAKSLPVFKRIRAFLKTHHFFDRKQTIWDLLRYLWSSSRHDF
jgi:hypothetical protein